jgi:hypothetical protein
VKDLHDILSRRGLKTGNDLERDLFIANTKGKIITVFQVITDASGNSIQSGAGQLLIANTDLPEQPRLILTLPESIDETLETKLKKLGIDVLVYEWQCDQAVFPNLSAVIS